MRFFHIEQHTCSDDGLWASKTDDGFAIIEFQYWAELDSSAVETHGKYNIQAGYVYLTNLDRNLDALKSCGWEFDESGNIWSAHSGDIVAAKGTRAFRLVIASALWGYGSKDVYGDFSGNNRAELFKQARNCL